VFNMATEDQLKQALIKAHNAGDTEAATLFAQKIKEMRSAPQAPVATPAQDPTIGQQVLGGLENVASFVTGAVAEPIAGLSGLAAAAIPGGRTGAEQVEATREALTFQPVTEQGQAQQQAVAEALEPVAQAVSSTERFLGDKTLELTGSPELAAMAHTLPTAALEAIGLKGASRATRVGQPSRKLIEKTLVESAPEINQVKNASRVIFKELDNSGVAIKQTALKRLERNLDKITKTKGIRERVTPEAFGAIEEIKKDIALGNSLTTTQMDELRSIAKNSIVATDANKVRVGSAIVDEIDSFLDGIKPVDIEKGAQLNVRDVGKKYKAARDLWGRAKRAEMLQEAIEMGASRKAGVEKGIRNELNNLLNRKKSRKFLSAEDVKAIRKVTDGDFKQNFASLLGGMGLKLENSPGLVGSVLGGGGVAALASSIPGLSGALAPVAIGAITVGTVSKEIAKKITQKRASFLKNMAASGNDAKRITRAYLNAVPKSKRKISDLSDLLLDPNVDLNALENVSNEMVKDAVKAAQFKRDLIKASTALGIGQVSNNGEDNNDGN